MESKLYFLVIGVFLEGTLSSSEWEDGKQPMVPSGDMLYDDFLEFAHSHHLYHAYTFSSGVGNRERLEIEEVNLDSNLKLGENVRQWIKLKLREELYLVGIREKGFTIMNVKHEDNTSIINEKKIELEYKVSTLALFEYRNSLIRKKEVILVVVIDQGLYNCLWYRIKENNIEKFWELPLLKKVTCLKIFQYENDYNILFANDHGVYGSSLEIFRVEFRNDVPFIWFLQLIPLKYTTNSVSLTNVNNDIFMSVVQNPLNTVTIFKYQPFCPETNEGKFVPHGSLLSENVTVVHTFFMASQNYILINGNRANIFVFNWNGEIEAVFENRLGFIEDWLIIDVETYRYDVILLARNYVETNLITWGGSLDGFVINVPHPSCYRVNERHEKVAELSKDLSCMNELSWKGAASIQLGHLPVLIIVGSQYSHLYHIVYSLTPVMNPEWDILRVDLLKNTLNKEWNMLKQRYEDYGIEIGYDDGLRIESMKKRMREGKETDANKTAIEEWPSLVDLENLLFDASGQMSTIEQNLFNCENTLYSRNNSFQAFFEGERDNSSDSFTGFFNSTFEGYLWFEQPLIIERRENETIKFELKKDANQVAAHGILTFVVGKDDEVQNEVGSFDWNDRKADHLNNVKDKKSYDNLEMEKLGYQPRYNHPEFTPEIAEEKQRHQIWKANSLGNIVDEGLNTNARNLPHYYSLIDKD